VGFFTQRCVLNQVVLPVGIAKKGRRHRNDFARRAGGKPGAGIAPRLQTAGQHDRERHRIVRQHFLCNRGDAIEQIVQLTGIGQRRQQLVEQLEVRGPRAQLLVRAGLFREPLMREREREVIGDPPPHHHVVAGEGGPGATVEVHAASQPPFEPDG